MEKKKQTMKYFALSYRGDALLLYKLPGGEYGLPAAKSLGELRKLVKETLGFKKAKLEKMPPFFIARNRKKSRVNLYLIRAEEWETPADAMLRYAPLGEEEIPALDEVSRLVFLRADSHAPLYLGTSRTVPFLRLEEERVKYEEDCLKFFHRYIPSSERKQFHWLHDSATSFRRMNLAFASLCNTFRVDPKNYDEYLVYKAKRDEALKK